MKRIIVIIILLLISLSVYSQNRPGLNIDIFLKISGLWSTSLDAKPYEYCDDCYEADFGWGKSKYWPNGSTLIDPVKNEFQWCGLHLISFKSFKQINSNTIDIELYFLDGNILRYRITIDQNGYLSFIDSGSTMQYQYLKGKLKKLAGPNLKNYKYGKINNTSVRIREKPSTKGKIIDIIPQNTRILIIRRSEKTEEINGEIYYWDQVVSDTGFIGWVYEKYIDFDK